MRKDSPNTFEKIRVDSDVFIPAEKPFSLHCLPYPIRLPLHESFLSDGNQMDAALARADFPIL